MSSLEVFNLRAIVSEFSASKSSTFEASASRDSVAFDLHLGLLSLALTMQLGQPYATEKILKSIFQKLFFFLQQ